MRRTFIFTSGVIVAALLASVLVQRRAAATLYAHEALMRQQDARLAELAAENQRLSNQVVRARATGPAGQGLEGELARLRAEAERLRGQTNQLSENRRIAGAQVFSRSDHNLLEHNVMSDSTGPGAPMASRRLNDATALIAALRQYADEHQGRFPLSLDEVTPYLPKSLEPKSPGWANRPVIGTNEFEIIYQGTQNDLTDIPLRRVALIRKREPGLTPAGKQVATYGYADGSANTIESDDNFQSWEAQHVIPAPAASP